MNSTLSVNGVTHVSERPTSGTCNGNGFYQASYETSRSGWAAATLVRFGGRSILSSWTGTSFGSSQGYAIDGGSSFR